MKVVATRSFFGSGINAKKGVVIEVSDKLAKAWLKAGLAVKADGKAEPSVVATTSPKSPETTGEVVDDQNADEQSTDGDPDKEGETGNDGEGGDEPTEPTQNTNPNQEKASK